MIPVRLTNATIRSGFGNDYGDLWRSFGSDTRPLAQRAIDDLAAHDPKWTELAIDRKTARATDKQSRLLLAAAIECADAVEEAQRALCGLYLGLPTVDEPVPHMSALQDWHEDCGRTPLSEHLKRHTAPLAWLSMLNSSAAAHVSARLRITGPMAVYSPFGDAGLNALIDAALAVADGECSQALVGAVSPKHDPILTVQYAHWCTPDQRVPLAEASACLLLSSTGDDEVSVDDTICMHGYARGFEPTPWRDHASIARGIESAIAMAGLAANDIGWVLMPSAWNAAQQQALSAVTASFVSTAAVLPVERVLGRLGPAAPVLAAGLVMQGLKCGYALHCEGSELQQRALRTRNCLVVALGPHGQYAVTVIGGAR